MKVVFDWDGVFNNLTEYLCELLKIPQPNEYISRKSLNLTEGQADLLHEAYKDMSLYVQAPLVEGFREVILAEPRYYICSCNTSREMLEFKRTKVSEVDFTFPEDHLILWDGLEKPPVKDADVVVEDYPGYLEKYGDDVVKILIDHSYNREETRFIRLPNLAAALKYIEWLKTWWK